MNTLPLITGVIGIATSVVLMLLSILIPQSFVSKAEHELDEVRFGSKAFSKRESTVVGMLLHAMLSFFFGVVYGACLNAGVLSVDAVSLGIYFLVTAAILGGIILPLEGHGFFGWKEDHWISVDLLAMNALWILIFWALLAVLI